MCGKKKLDELREDDVRGEIGEDMGIVRAWLVLVCVQLDPVSGFKALRITDRLMGRDRNPIVCYELKQAN